MNIWIVNHYALPPGARGGPTRHLGLSRAWRDRGHDVTIVASLFDHYTRRDHRAVEGGGVVVDDLDGVRYAWVRTPPYGGVAGRIRNMASFGVRAAWRAPSLLGPPPDVVVGSSPHLLTGLAARRIARRCGAPFVMEVRDVWPQSLVDLGEMGPHNPAMRVLRVIERRLYRTADHVVVVPPSAVDHVVASGGSPGRVTVVPNGVDLAAYPPPSPPARRDGRPFTLVYAGTVGLANGLEVVVDAAALLRQQGIDDVRIRIVGAGPRRDTVAARARDLGVDDRVTVERAVPSGDVPALLAAADVCLLVLRDSPVFRWGISPTKLFDYMAAGRPVLSSVDAPPDPSLAAGAGVRVPASDPAALAAAAVRLRDLPVSELAAMGARGRAYVETHHSFTSLAERYERLLSGVVAGPTGRVRRWT